MFKNVYVTFLIIFEKIYGGSFASLRALLMLPQQEIKGNLIRE